MRHNLRRGIHRGGEVSSSNGLGNPTPTDPASVAHVPIFVPPGFTCRPSGALGYLVYCVFYKHVAPLGLNASQFAAWYPSWGRGFLVQRVGEPNPYGSNFACSRSNFRASRFTCRPSGAKCVTICGAVSIVGRVLLAQRVGEPNPYGSSFACSRSSFRASRFTCRPSGAKCGTICGAVSIMGSGLLA